MTARVTIVGAGLAGSEAALTLANHGISVELIDQKPHERTPAQTSEHLCELVCSNSMRGAALSNAVGLLKEELRRAGSHVMAAADATRVPAGGALAVDRERFARTMTERLRSHPKIAVHAERVDSLPEARPLVIATGPLTGDRLAEDIARHIGSEALAYYDAIAPIVSAESIDWSKVFLASRWEKGESDEDKSAYVNCPLNEAEYAAFVQAVREARTVLPRAFEEPRYFEGCLPIEVMAERGEQTLAFGPMKPVGLTDPRTGRRPYAVVQLRKEDEAGTAYNLVGFQTRMARPEQERIFRTIPGLENAEFFRFGAVHRNTFLNAPKLLEKNGELRGHPGLYFAGQISGVEGYVESAASGLLVALFLIDRMNGRPPLFPPETTAFGGLLTHLARTPSSGGYQPSNITFSHLPPLSEGRRPRLKKRARYEALAERALSDFDTWLKARQPVPQPLSEAVLG